MRRKPDERWSRTGPRFAQDELYSAALDAQAYRWSWMTRGTALLPKPRRRADIQGLRAVAVLLVVLNHAGIESLQGGYVGVDVFFVLSGFLITGLLIGDAEKNQQVSLANFYVRRARRILPAATLTLCATAIASYYILNVVRAKEAFTDIAWSAFFAANIHFSNVGTDYFAQDRAVSPVRHFWSLAVEEQFYIVWPAVVGFAFFGFALLRRERPHDRARITMRSLNRLTAVIVLVFVASLAWSIHQTQTEPTVAYFSTLTRGWELALGAALATVVGPLAQLRAWTRFAMGWAGLAAIAIAAVLFNEQTPFPGFAALLPTGGAALVIAAGVAARQPRFGAGWFLSMQPMRYIGDLSYTIYLWHWPILVLAAAEVGHVLSVTTNLALVGAAFLLSVVTYTCFENPIHRSRWPQVDSPRANPVLLGWIAAPLIVMIVVGLGRQGVATEVATASAAQYKVEAARDAKARAQSAATAEERARSATRQAAREERALRTNGALPQVLQAAAASEREAKVPSSLTPNPATEDLPKKYIAPISPECSPFGSKTTSNICSRGSGSKTLVVFGDSHAQMWLPAIDALASQSDYVVRPVVKSACSMAYWGGDAKPPPGCLAWYSWARQKIRDIRPDIVLVAAHYMPNVPGVSHSAPSVARALDTLLPSLRRTSGRVIVLGDVFGQREPTTDCLLRKDATLGSCSAPYDDARIAFYENVADRTRKLKSGFVDTRGWFCARTACPMVVDGTVVFADKSHVTTTYASVLASVFARQFKKALS
ncbi:MAG: acyltransferase [Solirubrobacteraceae bacterium]|nr:acyltransferase [Solirubrobacteraceae bacterium]